MRYLSIDEIKKEFANHLKKYRGYTDEEAAIAVSDFPNPYSNCYLDEDWVGDCEIEEVAYKKYTSSTALWRVGMPNVPDFFFYTYYRTEDVPNNKVGEYMNARKLFQIEELDAEDFPMMPKKRRRK